MSDDLSHDTFRLEEVSALWERVADHIDALGQAWDRWTPAETVPMIASYVPREPRSLRLLALPELIKLDLEQRWRDRRMPRRLEEYLAEFPELDRGAGVSPDLIVEEFHVRRQCGDDVTVEEYFQRFPKQQTALAKLLDLNMGTMTTTFVGKHRAPAMEVGQTVDDFELLAQLGQGAFATVFLARQKSMQRIVALKVSADQGNEPQTMSGLEDHPHIVRVYDQRVMRDRSVRLLYMQYVPGGTLQAVVEHLRSLAPEARTGRALLEAVDRSLAQRGESPPADSTTRRWIAGARWPLVVCWLGTRLAMALDYSAHKGVLHRDVKPANVLLTGEGSPKLADFNISFSEAVEGATAAAYFGGSLAYMSPEQLEACNPDHARKPDSLDGRSDVYSLGVMLYELLALKRPFDDQMLPGGYGETLADMCQRRRGGLSAAALTRLPADCPEGLIAVLRRALAYDVNDRYATAGQLARDLELFLRPQAEQLYRPMSHGWRAAARKHVWLALLLAGLMPNLVCSPMNIWYNYKAVFERALGPGRLGEFLWQLTVVNSVAYGLGMAILLSMALPLLRAVRRPPPAEEARSVRRRCMRMGDYVAGVVFVLWPTCGLVFPAWIQAIGGEIAPVDYMHILVSQLLCGLVATTQAYFAVTFQAVRVMLPVLAPANSLTDEDVADGLRLRERIGFYFVTGVVILILSLLFSAIMVREKELTSLIVVTGALGIMGFGITFKLSNETRSDLAAFIEAAAPPGENFSLSGSTADSFLASSRRKG